MCTFATAPPSLSFFWPWQAPGNWLPLGLLVALVGVSVAINYRRMLPYSVLGRRREVVVGVSCAGFTLGLAGLVLLFTVVMPSSSALFGWQHTQLPWAIAHHCTDGLWATFDAVSSSYATLSFIAGLGLFIGFVTGLLALCTAVPPYRFTWLRQWWEMRTAPR